MMDPCMSCGDDRRRPAPQQCKQPNGHVQDCRAEHGVGHIDCPKCWRWSPRNPNQVS